MRPHPVPAGGGGLWGPEPLACEPRGNSTFRPLPDPDSMFDLGRYGPPSPHRVPTCTNPGRGQGPSSPWFPACQSPDESSRDTLFLGPDVGADGSCGFLRYSIPSKLRGRNGGHCQKLQASWQLGPRTGRRDIGLEGLVVERRWV